MRAQWHVEHPGSTAAQRSPARGGHGTVQLTGRDLELLSFAAEHRLVLAAHIQKLLGISASAARARLRVLGAAGYLRQERRFYRSAACYLVTGEGLAATSSRYSQPRFSYPEYAHDVGLAWLWLAAKGGVWGRISEVVSERRLRSTDAAADRPGEPIGVRLGGYGPSGKQRLHYPDLLLIYPDGHRVALELELTAKSRTRLETILGGYAADGRIDAVVYLVERRSIGRSIEAAARRFGIEDLVHVQLVRRDDASKPGGAARAYQRMHAHDDRSADTEARARPTPPRTPATPERRPARPECAPAAREQEAGR